MKTMLNRIRLRDAALFAFVAGVVAVVVVLVGREAGVGEQAGAGADAVSVQPPSPAQEQQSDEGETPLTLTLFFTGPEICETELAREMVGGGLRTNDRGSRYVSYGWAVRSEIAVRWRISGGTAPYTILIDGESRDAREQYAGALGSALVGCADTSVGTSFDDVGDGVQRIYAADPQVDSGLKTIRGVVTDAEGRTAEASAEIYVIVIAKEPTVLLKSGQTYRVYGRLLTIPQGDD